MAALEEKESFTSLNSTFDCHCQDLTEMCEKGENVGLVEDAVKSKKFNSFLRRSHSERNHRKDHKQKQAKSRTFSSIFLKKKVEEKRTTGQGSKLESKSSQTNLHPKAIQMECAENMAETNKMKKEHLQLVKSLEDKENCVVELEKEKEILSTRIKDLELELEESRLNNALSRGTQREKEVLRKRLEAMNDEKESLEFHMAFLEEEKIDAETKVKNLMDDMGKLQAKLEKCESDRELYKKKFLHTKSYARQVISEYIDDVNELIQENRFLIKKGIRGKPKELERILRVTDEHLQLQSERNRFQESNEILSERIAKQEVNIEDLKRELVSAVILLEKAGIDWKPMYVENVGVENISETCDRNGSEQTDEKFGSPREDKIDDEKIEIPLSIANQRPVKPAGTRITVI